MIRYLDAYGEARAPKFLWQMMEESMDEPDTRISHEDMPSWDEHVLFLKARSRRVLLLIEDDSVRLAEDELVGFVSLTYMNEIGVRIRKAMRGRGHGALGVQHIITNYAPMPAQASVRQGRFIANINPANAASIALFTKLGAKHIQNTYRF